MCFQTTNIDFKHRPFIVSKICTQSLPPRSPMRILQYVGQVWHAVVSWSDFPLQGMSQTRTECNRTGQASCCVFTQRKTENTEAASTKRLSRILVYSFLCGIFCMTTVTTQKNMFYILMHKDLFMSYFSKYIFRLLVLEPWKHMITISLALAFSFLSLRSHWSLWGLAPIKRFTSDW